MAHIPKEGTLETNTAQDGQTAVFTALHYRTNSVHASVKVKIDTGTQACAIPLSCFMKMFPYKFNNHSILINDALLPTNNMWVNHDGYPQHVLGQTILHMHHTTTGKAYPT